MIYIAAPYSSKEKEVTIARVKKVCEYSADLLVKRISCVSPITLGTGIMSEAKLPTDFEFWQHLSYDLLELCKTMHVLKLDGWDESIGVLAEIKFALENNIEIVYIDMYDNKGNSRISF